ncbi:hypothetical protein C8046_16360 [Serinibacter arcticus]|uniref:Lipoprotein n=1 Tax=Serinibacter arcticus TaxID=1655435 RepID=A0A2U1ZYI9_9MICO|nr:hypothetical protein [Serinibacter arcticus]PWD51982.1 hypothetical protein C8046_16360 [Serinibacter arcticus]
MRRSARLAVVPLAAALLLTGCGRPGTAATVDGQRVTEAQVATLVDELSQLSTGTVAPAGALNSMIAAPTVLRVAAEDGYAFSHAQAVQLLDDSAAELQLGEWDYSEQIVTFVRQSIVIQQLQQDPAAEDTLDEMLAEIADLDVEVNPRFGAWEAGAVVAQPWPWMIPTAAEAPTS